MKRIAFFLPIVLAAMASSGAVPIFYDDFDALYDVGQNFTTLTNGWQASADSAYVTNTGAYSGKGVVLNGAVVLTNGIAADPGLKVWTDLRIRPFRGELPDAAPTNEASFLAYFTTEGALALATTNGGWLYCTNDVWGHPVPALTNDATYVRLSFVQDYGTTNQAVFLDDRLVVQDLPFAVTAGHYDRLGIQNGQDQSWLDNVWVQTNYDSATLTNSYNGDAVADVREVQLYGYAWRTLYVCAAETNLFPVFSNVTSALAEWRPRDLVHVMAGDYSGDDVIIPVAATQVVFEGAAFSVNSLTIPSGATVTFAQSVSCGSLALTGQVTMAEGAVLTSTTAHVEGLLSISTNGSFVVDQLTILGAGLVTLTSNTVFQATGAGVTLEGPFTLSNTWSAPGLVSMPLPFLDTFDPYALDTVITNLKFRGWYASDEGPRVQATAYAGKAAAVPDGSVVSNSIVTSQTNIWTDFYLRPMRGDPPDEAPTNTAAFVAYANADGYLVVGVSTGWRVCSNKLDAARTPATPISFHAFARISVFHNFANHTFAVFVNGDLVAQALPAPANVSTYSSFGVDNRGGWTHPAYVDEVVITTSLPADLIGDLDEDGSADASEIHRFGTLTAHPAGTEFRFR